MKRLRNSLFAVMVVFIAAAPEANVLAIPPPECGSGPDPFCVFYGEGDCTLCDWHCGEYFQGAMAEECGWTGAGGGEPDMYCLCPEGR